MLAVVYMLEITGLSSPSAESTYDGRLQYRRATSDGAMVRGHTLRMPSRYPAVRYIMARYFMGMFVEWCGGGDGLFIVRCVVLCCVCVFWAEWGSSEGCVCLVSAAQVTLLNDVVALLNNVQYLAFGLSSI